MFTPISVSLSGPAFSFLLYENSKCRFQQEGFLLGEIVHKETKTITDNDQQQVNIKIPPELFTCCLLNSEVSDNAATHSFSQYFVRCNNIGYEKLPIHIPNLSESNNTYKNSEPASETFCKILGDLKIDKKNTQGLVVINKIQNALQKHIDSVVETLAESEKYMYELEEEVKNLQTLKKLKKMNELDSQRRDDHDQELPLIDNSPTLKKKTLNSINSYDSDLESTPEVARKQRSNTVKGKGRKREIVETNILIDYIFVIDQRY
ncbi:hypothetical protein JTB14_010677 [Gonioctena quinquepunctata]|nr:hypothetical protein JTB14_010677 [Gonioctena quinquepunctata]